MIFLIFGSSLACLEPELELFEVDAVGDDDDLSHVCSPTCKQCLGARTSAQRGTPDPLRMMLFNVI